MDVRKFRKIKKGRMKHPYQMKDVGFGEVYQFFEKAYRIIKRSS